MRQRRGKSDERDNSFVQLLGFYLGHLHPILDSLVQVLVPFALCLPDGVLCGRHQ